MHIRSAAVVLGSTLLLAATGAEQSVTIHSSNVSFSQAMSACPNALAGVSIALGHVRVAALAGVDSDIAESANGIETVTLTGAGGKSATVVVNGHANTVSAKNVTTARRSSVACIAPD